MHLFLAPLLTLALLQTPAAAAPATAPSTNSGTGAMSSFRDDALRLTYSFPTAYTDATAMVGPAFQASLGNDPATAAAAKCLTLPLSRMSTGNGQLAMVMLVRADSGCMGKKFTASSLPEFTQGEAQGLAASGAKTSFGKPVSLQVAGRPASMIEGSFSVPTGQTLNTMVICVLDQPDVACWQFMSNAADRLRSMAAFPVTFDGSPAVPLLPPGSTGQR